MHRPTVEIDLTKDLERHGKDLSRGGIFVPGTSLPVTSECVLVLRHGEAELRLTARVVWDGGGSGVGLEIVGFNERKAEVAAFAEQAGAGVSYPTPTAALSTAPATPSTTVKPRTAEPAAVEPETAEPAAVEPETAEPVTAEPNPADGDDDAPDRDKMSRSVHERLRGLNMVEQSRVAREGDIHERIALERIYSKAVWEPLLRNPRLTPPEVARIARMGTLPRPLLEVILNNGAWLGVPEIRRALLGNPRLSADMIPRILRQMPKHELKLVPTQTVYPASVRDTAKRMLSGAHKD